MRSEKQPWRPKYKEKELRNVLGEGSAASMSHSHGRCSRSHWNVLGWHVSCSCTDHHSHVLWHHIMGPHRPALSKGSKLHARHSEEMEEASGTPWGCSECYPASAGDFATIYPGSLSCWTMTMEAAPVFPRPLARASRNTNASGKSAGSTKTVLCLSN